MNLVSMINVGKNYLDVKFNIEINKNDFILVNGKNGSGKSTFIKLLSRYIKKDFGVLKTRYKKITYISENQNLPLNIKANKYIKILEKYKKGKVNKNIINSFGIPLEKRIGELSKGNKQKLLIATSLIGNSDLIIYDEPLSGLDDKSVDLYIKYLKRIKNNHTIVISTHKPEKFINIANKRVIL